MRILQVTNGYPPTATAGVEQYTRQLSRGLSAHHDVRIFCRESNPEQDDYDLLDEPFEGLPVRRVVNDFQQVSQIADFYLDRRIESIFEQTLQEWQPDLVHFQHCIGLSASLLEAAARAGIPHLLTLHDYWFLCSRVQLLHRRGHICPGPVENVDCARCAPPPTDLFRPVKGTRLHRVLRLRLNERVKQGILAAQGGLARYLTAIHGEPARLQYQERYRYMVSLLANTPLMLTPSRFTRGVFVRHGVPQASIEVLPLGLDLGPWRGADHSQPVHGAGLRVGYLGTLLQHKGVEILVRAFRRLAQPGSTLAIHGSVAPNDPFGSRLRQLVGDDPRARLMGRYHQQDLPRILGGIDVVVIPSLWHETFSIVAREALLSGTPVIASHVGALPEIIHDGQNGLLVPAGDVEALHATLHRLSTDPHLLARLRQGARLSAPRIKSMEDHIDEVEERYRRLARRAG